MHSLRDASMAVRTALRDALAEVDLTPVQNTALHMLEVDPGSSSAELARRMHVTPQTMHKLVTDLEHAGLVELSRRPGHGRILDTNLTKHGRQVLAEAHARVETVEERLMASLSERQQQQLLGLLRRCVAALDPHDDAQHDPAGARSGHAK